MAKKTTSRSSTSSMSAEEKKWRVQRNADILLSAAQMSASDRKAAQTELKNRARDIQLACGGKLK